MGVAATLPEFSEWTLQLFVVMLGKINDWHYIIYCKHNEYRNWYYYQGKKHEKVAIKHQESRRT